MGDTTRWLLPNGIDELLPEQAHKVESVRRRLLDCCQRWGYEYVVPPLVEFTDSLLVGMGADLDLLTCKFSDQESGRTLGVRADITPQAARIDAHSLGREDVTRLCYSGSTLRAVANTIPADRSPVQLGAEIFGCLSIDADIEMSRLLLSLLEQATTPSLTLDIGHVGFAKSVIDALDVTDAQREVLVDLLQQKSGPGLKRFVKQLDDEELASRVATLADMHGGTAVIDIAAEAFGDVPGVTAMLDQIAVVVASSRSAYPDINIYIDLTEYRGFKYHTGLVFSVYAEGVGVAIAKGGRYDNVGSAFGRARAATGFAIDLKTLAGFDVSDASQPDSVVSSPIDACEGLVAKEKELRSSGYTVVKALDGLHDRRADLILTKQGSEWQLVPIGSK